jgi:transcription antitermination factor NusG
MLSRAGGSLMLAAQPWWVVHTKPRCEKALAWDLERSEIAYFLPLVRRTVYGGGRRRISLVPLFSSYLFVAGDEQARYAVLQTHRACNIIPVEDQHLLVSELTSIERALAGEATLDLCPQAVVGRMMRVTHGPFRDVVGKVIRRDSVTRLMMQVSILGRAVEMDIDADLLEPAE